LWKFVGPNGRGTVDAPEDDPRFGTNVTAGEGLLRGATRHPSSAHRRVAPGSSIRPRPAHLRQPQRQGELRTGAQQPVQEDCFALFDKSLRVFPKLETRATQRAGPLSAASRQMLPASRARHVPAKKKNNSCSSTTLARLSPIIVASLTKELQTPLPREAWAPSSATRSTSTHVGRAASVLEKGRFVTILDVSPQ